MRELNTGEYIPTELDADFTLSIGDPYGDGEMLIDEGTPIGVHHVEYEGATYEIRCTVRLLPTDSETNPTPRVSERDGREVLGYCVRYRCDDLPWSYSAEFFEPHDHAEAEEYARGFTTGPGDGWIAEVVPVVRANPSPTDSETPQEGER